MALCVRRSPFRCPVKELSFEWLHTTANSRTCESGYLLLRAMSGETISEARELRSKLVEELEILVSGGIKPEDRKDRRILNSKQPRRLDLSEYSFLLSTHDSHSLIPLCDASFPVAVGQFESHIRRMKGTASWSPETRFSCLILASEKPTYRHQSTSMTHIGDDAPIENHG